MLGPVGSSSFFLKKRKGLLVFSHSLQFNVIIYFRMFCFFSPIINALYSLKSRCKFIIVISLSRTRCRHSKNIINSASNSAEKSKILNFRNGYKRESFELCKTEKKTKERRLKKCLYLGHRNCIEQAITAMASLILVSFPYSFSSPFFRNVLLFIFYPLHGSLFPCCLFCCTFSQPQPAL